MSLGAVSSTLYTTGNTAAEETEDDPAIPANSEDYSMMEPTDDIYKVPGSNQPVNPGELPEGVLFQVSYKTLCRMMFNAQGCLFYSTLSCNENDCLYVFFILS